jgi:NAD-dependent DNA ligase
VIDGTSPLMPKEEYVWNDTHVDIMLVNKEDNKTVKIKEIHGFFKTLEVEKLGEANIEKIINIGANSIPKILALKVEEFEKVENFGKKMATKVHDSIKEKIANASLVKIAGASNIFGRGFKEARVKLILDEYPDILTLHEEDKIKLEKVKKIDNIGEKTGKQFVDNISNFIKFLKDSNLEYKLTQQPQQPQQPQEQPQQPQQPQLLKDKTLLMSDFKSATLTKKELQEKIESIGGKVVNSFTNNIDILIVGSLDNESGKLKKVKDYNTKAEKKNSPLIEIITVDDFIKKYLN